MCNTVSLLAVTNRHLSVHPYPEQIARICQTHPKGLILREKDLAAESYLALAAQVLDICHKYDVPCILHTFWKEAIALGCTSIHLPLPLLRRLSEKGDSVFSAVYFLHGSWYFRPFRGRSPGSRTFGCYLSHCRTHLCDRL